MNIVFVLNNQDIERIKHNIKLQLMSKIKHNILLKLYYLPNYNSSLKSIAIKLTSKAITITVQ